MSPEHRAKLSASNKATRLAWSPEKREAMRKKNSESHIGTGLGNKKRLGSIPWNKGNNWRRDLSREVVRERNRLQMQRYRAENPRVRVDDRVSAMIRQALKAKKAGKKWESLVGYSVEDLMRHLEALFVDGMSWDNMGEWHIDHIKPRSSFNFDTPDSDEFRACWELSNLRPLWAIDNLRKGSSLEL